MNQSPLTDEEARLLHDIFRRLWGNRTGVVGSFGASSYRYHPTFIRRGALLLEGETHFARLHVLVPADAKVTPHPEAPASHFNCFPNVDGSATQIALAEAGPWWGALRAELPKMLAELAESEQRRVDEQRAADEKAAAERRERLARAAAVFGEGVAS